jgi:cysteine synthase A/phenylacetate-CoA ligase
MEVRSVSFSLPIEQHIRQLSGFKPEVLYTMPSILDRILQASGDSKSFGIRHVVLVGETASPGWIRSTAERLGIGIDRITDTYGSIEIGTIAYYSHEYGRYLVTEGLYAEGIGAEQLGDGFDPLPDEEKVLVLTSSERECFPALRYVTYDVVRDLRPVLVGGKLRQSFQSIVKRIGPDLKHGEKISIYDIEQIVYRHITDASLRVKIAGNELIVQVIGPDSDIGQLADIQRDIENCIPEIGVMIGAGILNRIQVCGGLLTDVNEQGAGPVKHKKIVFE